MSRNIDYRQSPRGRGRGRSISRSLIPQPGRISVEPDGEVENPEMNALASSSRSGPAMFPDARNLVISGGNMVATDGPYLNVTINNVREEENKPNETEIGERPRKRARTTAPSAPVQRPLSQRSCEVYYRNLAVKKRGSPLWIPEPSYNLPIHYQRKGVSIGDVGVLSATGSFNFFFNISLPRDHPVNIIGVPEGFHPLTPPLDPFAIQMLQEFNENSCLASESIEISRRHSDSSTTDLTFESSAEEGAILTMPHGALSEDLVNTLHFRRYMARHAEKWYRYIIGIRGCEAKNGDVRLVIGCDKTDAWGMAMFVKSTETVRLKFQPMNTGGSYKWEYSGSFDTRTGPNQEATERLRQGDENSTTGQGVYNNQCLFARTLNANLREDIWKNIMDEIYSDLEVRPDAGCSDRESQQSSTIMPTGSLNLLSRGGSFGGGSGRTLDQLPLPEETSSLDVSNVSTAMMQHPSKVINELFWKKYQLDFPNAEMFMSDDDVWISALQLDDLSLPDPEELCNRIMAHMLNISLDLEDNCIFLHCLSNKPQNLSFTPINSNIGLDTFNYGQNRDNTSILSQAIKYEDGLDEDKKLDSLDDPNLGSNYSQSKYNAKSSSLAIKHEGLEDNKKLDTLLYLVTPDDSSIELDKVYYGRRRQKFKLSNWGVTHDSSMQNEDTIMNKVDPTLPTARTLLCLRKDNLIKLCKERAIQSHGTKAQLVKALLLWQDRQMSCSLFPISEGILQQFWGKGGIKNHAYTSKSIGISEFGGQPSLTPPNQNLSTSSPLPPTAIRHSIPLGLDIPNEPLYSGIMTMGRGTPIDQARAAIWAQGWNKSMSGGESAGNTHNN